MTRAEQYAPSRDAPAAVIDYPHGRYRISALYTKRWADKRREEG